MNRIDDLRKPPDAPIAPVFRPGRDAWNRFVPGYSGNPSGRPAGIERICRGLLDDGGWDFIGRVVRGELDENNRPLVASEKRVEVIFRLVERVYGKAVAVTATIGVGGGAEGTFPVDRANLGDLAALGGIVARTLASIPVPSEVEGEIVPAGLPRTDPIPAGSPQLPESAAETTIDAQATEAEGQDRQPRSAGLGWIPRGGGSAE